MSLPKTLRVKHTVTYEQQPLMVVANFPGEGAELTPIAARRLAVALLDAAAECEELHDRVCNRGPHEVGYVLSSEAV